MNKTETNRFHNLYERHLRLLKLDGKSQKTIDGYSRGVRRISECFDCCPDQLTLEQREQYFSALIDSHSWSTVKVDRNGLQFFAPSPDSTLKTIRNALTFSPMARGFLNQGLVPSTRSSTRD